MYYPQRTKRTHNLSPRDRLISAAAGAGLLALAIRFSKALRIPLMLGSGLLVFRSASGRDPISQSVLQALGIYREDGETTVRVQRSITVNRPRAEVYSYWRDFTHFPSFMEHLESVNYTNEDGTTSHWVAKSPLGKDVEWDSQLTEEHENELLAWQSLPGSEVENFGKVTFYDAPGQNGTVVSVDFRYKPPIGGTAGVIVGKLTGEEPDQQVHEDLRRFKRLIETGDVISTKGQPSARTMEVEKQRDQVDDPFERLADDGNPQEGQEL